MSELREIAERKIQSEMTFILEKLDRDMEAMFRRQAANGMRKSGNTFLAAMDLMKNSSQDFCARILEQHEWVLRESLFTSRTLVKSLKDQAGFYVHQHEKHSANKLREAARIAGNEHFFEKYMPDIVGYNQNLLDTLHADIDAQSITTKHKWINHFVATAIAFAKSLTKGS